MSFCVCLSVTQVAYPSVMKISKVTKTAKEPHLSKKEKKNECCKRLFCLKLTFDCCAA